jgi:hypothetical protein
MTTEYVRRYIDPRHMVRFWIDPRLGSLRPSELIAYLGSKVWKELPPAKNGLLAFQEPTGDTAEGRPYCQFVPLDEDYGDYRQIVVELISGLAAFENRSAQFVIDDILALVPGERTNGVSTRSEAGVS